MRDAVTEIAEESHVGSTGLSRQKKEDDLDQGIQMDIEEQQYAICLRLVT